MLAIECCLAFTLFEWVLDDWLSSDQPISSTRCEQCNDIDDAARHSGKNFKGYHPVRWIPPVKF